MENPTTPPAPVQTPGATVNLYGSDVAVREMPHSIALSVTTKGVVTADVKVYCRTKEELEEASYSARDVLHKLANALPSFALKETVTADGNITLIPRDS